MDQAGINSSILSLFIRCFFPCACSNRPLYTQQIRSVRRKKPKHFHVQVAFAASKEVKHIGLYEWLCAIHLTHGVIILFALDMASAILFLCCGHARIPSLEIHWAWDSPVFSHLAFFLAGPRGRPVQLQAPPLGYSILLPFI